MRARVSIRWAVTLFTACFLAVSLSLVLAAMMNEARRQWSADSLVHASSTAHLLAVASRETLRRGDLAALRQLVREVADSEAVERIAIADRKGRVLADSAPVEGPPELLSVAANPAGSSASHVDGGRVQVAMPIVRGTTPLGAVFVRCSLREHEAIFIALRRWGILMVVITILVACGTAYLFAALISHPLRRLARRMGSVAEGVDPKPLVEAGCWELRQMAQSFNRMSSSLQRRMGEMEILRTLGSAVSRSLDLHEVVHSAIQGVERALPGTQVRMWLHDPDGDHLVEWGGGNPVGTSDPVPLSEETILARALDTPKGILAGGAEWQLPVDPWLADGTGATSLAAVPLRVGDTPVGVMLAYRTGSADPLVADDIPFLSTAANEVALSIENARMFARETHMARLFQRVLFPEAPTFIEELEIAVRWQAAPGTSQMGGDYYDFIALPGGRWGIVIGDVCGKGALAASYTAMAKYALRSFAYETTSPAEILRRTNAALYAQLSNTDMQNVRPPHTPPALGGVGGAAPTFITMLCAIYDPASRRLVYSHAGHPLGTLARAGSRAAVPLDQGGPPVGVVPDADYWEEVLYLAPGDTLALYSDGIAEAARSEEIIEPPRIAELLRQNQDNSVQVAARAVFEEAIRVANGSAADDITLIVLRVKDPASPLALPVPTTAEIAAD